MITQHFFHVLILIVNPLCINKSSLIFNNLKKNEINVLFSFENQIHNRITEEKENIS